jgi:prolipoprotein diacylglyceryl transferase
MERAFYAKLETGQHSVMADRLFDLAAALRVDVPALFEPAPCAPRASETARAHALALRAFFLRPSDFLTGSCSPVRLLPTITTSGSNCHGGAVVPIAYIPSPPSGVVHLGPVPLRAYAFCIIAGVFVAVAIGQRRWAARGGGPSEIADLAAVVVPVGLVGARIYHVITSPAKYLKDPVEVFYVWHGGLGIWGGVLGGAFAGWVWCRRRGWDAGALADALAPALPVAQAIGRIGNYFNQELFGRPTHLPWGLTVSPSNPDAVAGAVAYHPTFLYELLWDLGVAALVVALDRRFHFRRGRAFAVYVMAYTVGRAWIEALRIDGAQHFFGIRLNDYVSAVVFLSALTFFVLTRNRPTAHEASDDVHAATADQA